MAFARVKLGRSDGQCHSRLGFPFYAYQTILSKNTNYSVTSLLKTSYGIFNATLQRKSVDKHGGAVIDFSIDNQDSSKYIHKGISGATITTSEGGRSLPIGMVLKIQQDLTTLRALRYDYIKDQFDKLQIPKDSTYQHDIDTSNIPYEIIQTKYMPTPGDAGASSLPSASGCWKAAAIGGSRTIDIVIAVNKPNINIETIEVIQSSKCKDRPLKFWIEQRSLQDDNWAYVGVGTSVFGDDSPVHIALSAPREFRLRFEAAQNITISSIRLR